MLKEPAALLPGAGELWELRATDVDAAKCRRRYEVFKVIVGRSESTPACYPRACCMHALMHARIRDACVLVVAR